MQRDLWLKGSPLLVFGVMQSLSSYFPKQLPEITESGDLSIAVFPLFASLFALQEGARQRGN